MSNIKAFWHFGPSTWDPKFSIHIRKYFAIKIYFTIKINTFCGAGQYVPEFQSSRSWFQGHEFQLLGSLAVILDLTNHTIVTIEGALNE